jgi:hypothetical protein
LRGGCRIDLIAIELLGEMSSLAADVSNRQQSVAG